MTPTISLLGLLIVLSTTSTVEADTHLYPFGETKGDATLPMELDGSSPKLPTGRNKFQVFQSRDRLIYVNVNGAVSLHAPFPQWYTRSLPFSPDIFVAVFWVDHYLSHDLGVVWYRLSREKKDKRRGKNDVRENFGTCSNMFKPKWVLVATWEKVHSLGYLLEAYPNMSNPRYMRDTADHQRQRRGHHNSNTYQVVLLTDGEETFAILNYQKISWISSGDSLAVVGFNAGDGVKSYEHPLSGTADLADLVDGSNLNPAVTGRWMYKISGDQILAPGCNPVE